MKHRVSTPSEVLLKKHGKQIERYSVRLAELKLILNDIDGKHKTLVESIKDLEDAGRAKIKNFIKHLTVIQTFLKRFIRTLDFEYGDARTFIKANANDFDNVTYGKLHTYIESVACYQATVRDMILINKYMFKLYNEDFDFMINTDVKYPSIKQAYSGVSSIHHASLTMV